MTVIRTGNTVFEGAATSWSAFTSLPLSPPVHVEVRGTFQSYTTFLAFHVDSCSGTACNI
jgi:hypothetical protein